MLQEAVCMVNIIYSPQKNSFMLVKVTTRRGMYKYNAVILQEFFFVLFCFVFSVMQVLVSL